MKKHFKRIISLAIVAALAVSLAIPAVSLDIDEENYKYFKMEIFGQQPVTESYFKDNAARLYSPYNPVTDINAILSFSFQFSQPANIALYKCAQQVPGALPGEPY